MIWRRNANAGALICGFDVPTEVTRNNGASIPKGRMYVVSRRRRRHTCRHIIIWHAFALHSLAHSLFSRMVHTTHLTLSSSSSSSLTHRLFQYGPRKHSKICVSARSRPKRLPWNVWNVSRRRHGRWRRRIIHL